MFSKTKTSEPDSNQKSGETFKAKTGEDVPTVSEVPARTQKAKPPPSVLASDLKVIGNIRTSGDINIEGEVEGNIHAHLLTVGESATIKGECNADDVVVHGRVVGKVRGLKVRLTSNARVEGDIIHKTIAIESGAHFDGSVQRQKDPPSAKPISSPPKVSGSPAPDAQVQTASVKT
ncbi:MAG: polymer-forming cytoskeletal protein [Boseongicola sp.]|nr:polymer-forming cytoskeletal protein [Boseongicola sp.]MYH59936.1 polymer-forming cytoskeletal protein [Boseongicola sp. SB0675_bin_26]